MKKKEAARTVESSMSGMPIDRHVNNAEAFNYTIHSNHWIQPSSSANLSEYNKVRYQTSNHSAMFPNQQNRGEEMNFQTGYRCILQPRTSNLSYSYVQQDNPLDLRSKHETAMMKTSPDSSNLKPWNQKIVEAYCHAVENPRLVQKIIFEIIFEHPPFYFLDVTKRIFFYQQSPHLMLVKIGNHL